MKVTEIERFVLDVPFTPRCAEWNPVLHNVGNWSIIEVIRLRTDNDLVGYGETLPHYSWGRVGDDAIARVRGQNPAAFLDDDSLGPGLQMAVYDVVGKHLGVPVSALIGPRVRDRCPIAWWNTEMPAAVLAAEAEAAVAAGYTAHKFKPRPWFDVFQQVDALSAVTPEHYRLDLDWNAMLLTADNAVPVLHELDDYRRVAIYESPIPHSDLEGYAQLRGKVARPLAVHLKDQPFRTWIRERAVDGFVVEGGIAAMRRQGALAAAFGKTYWQQMVGAGLTTALCAHIGAVSSHARWPAVTCLNNYGDDLLVEPLRISAGCVEVPDGPGLGVEFDETALERYRMEPPYVHPERRHILTVAWPSGRIVHYAHDREQLWEDCLAGNHPVAERGVRFEVRLDDGSDEFARTYAVTSRAPVVEA